MVVDMVESQDLQESYKMMGYLKEAELRCKKQGKVEMAMMWKAHRILILEKIDREEFLLYYKKDSDVIYDKR